MNLSIYRCPVCYERLSLVERTFRCVNRHSYDVAREGYVNLLLANQKRTRSPGDNKPMVVHRRQFFAQGFYRPLSEQINALCAAFVRDSAENDFNMLDSGCGEGYFLANVPPALQTAQTNVTCWGVDISKHAVKAAAKKYKQLNWAVASLYALPMVDQSVDIVLNMMAPLSPKELHRVLRPSGQVIVVHPGSDHLFGLKQQIYTDPRKHKQPNTSLEGFRLIRNERVKHMIQLENKSIVDLFVMTPLSWNAPFEVRERIMGLEQLDVEVDFSVLVFERD